MWRWCDPDGVEQCDDRNQDDTDACRNDCTSARCGDGVTQTGVEQCDDANRTIPTDAQRPVFYRHVVMAIPGPGKRNATTVIKMTWMLSKFVPTQCLRRRYS